MELKRIDRFISRYQSWDDLYKELGSNKKFTQKFKGDVFERLTQVYLLTMPEYQSIISNVWLNYEVPRNILKKLNLPSEDFGVDLIAKTKRNEYWTIQCKFKSTNNALTYKELSTFSTLSFVNAKNIALGLVSHSSNKPIRNRKFLGNISEIGLDRWLNLNADEWKNIKKFCQHKPVKLVKRKPRPHQRKAINLSKKYFAKEKKSKGKLIMPCATGKSLTAFWIAQAINAKKIIVAVPSLNLVKQSLNDWTKEYLAHGITPEWLCICSDESAGKVDIDEFNTDTYDLGIPTTTNKKEIVSFLKRRSKNPKIIFTTYQSSPRLADSARAAKVSFEFAILDEAHKTVGMKGKSFSTLLFDQKIKIKKRLFMTATERILSGKKEEVVSMSDPKVYGEDVYVMTFKDAIQQDIISDYKVLTIAISDNEVNSIFDDNRFIIKDDSDEESGAQYLVSGIALKKTFKKHKIKHAISFHRSIKLSKKFAEQQDKLNEVKSLRPIVQNLHISSNKTSGQRVELIKEFTEAKRSLLTNARCLTEGIDVPAIDCVMFVDPKQSIIDIVQAAGRALRKFDDKDYGYIILPIVVPSNIDLEEFSKTTPFKKIVSIIGALSSQDERIAEQFNAEDKGKSNSGKIVNFEMNPKISKKIDISNFSTFIRTKVWEKVAQINFYDFDTARKIIRNMKIKSNKEWRYLRQKNLIPKRVPSAPDVTYKGKGWKSWPDFLGYEFLEFEEAKKISQTLEIGSLREWAELYDQGKIPENLPKYPRHTYRDENWDGPEFLGHGKFTKRNKYRSFIEARKYTRKLKLKNMREWRIFAKSGNKPSDIPFNPDKIYKNNGWLNWPDFLGNGIRHVKGFNYANFIDARSYARGLNLKTSNQWKVFCSENELPKKIPKYPQFHYKNKGWKGWADFLGY